VVGRRATGVVHVDYGDPPEGMLSYELLARNLAGCVPGGQAAPHAEVRIVGPEGRELPRGQIGEIVVRKPSAEVTGAEIRDHVKSLIAGYNAPRTVEFVDVLPATPTGKVIKRELRAKYWAGTERGVN
jgi:acyl-CoA synthetase (AMP-forming)/AMP-acid ligase II